MYRVATALFKMGVCLFGVCYGAGWLYYTCCFLCYAAYENLAYLNPLTQNPVYFVAFNLLNILLVATPACLLLDSSVASICLMASMGVVAFLWAAGLIF